MLVDVLFSGAEKASLAECVFSLRKNPSAGTTRSYLARPFSWRRAGSWSVVKVWLLWGGVGLGCAPNGKPTTTSCFMLILMFSTWYCLLKWRLFFLCSSCAAVTGPERAVPTSTSLIPGHVSTCINTMHHNALCHVNSCCCCCQPDAFKKHLQQGGQCDWKERCDVSC